MLRTIAEQNFKPPRDAVLNYTDFRGGWNTLFNPTELRANELAKSDNLYLVGRGVPTKRWGSQNYFMAGATGTCRGVWGVKQTGGSTIPLALTDWGYLTQKNGATYTMITGTSWPSGYNVEATQLNNTVYFISEQTELVRYNWVTLQSFTTLASPGGAAATNISGASGAYVYSWRITATTETGETLGSSNATLINMPQVLSDTLVRVSWSPLSTASGILTGYNIYRGIPGDEVYVGGVAASTTQFLDYGYAGSVTRQLPTANTTGGPRAKFMTRFNDRLILSGLPGEPTKVLVSGRVPQHERFDWTGGGGTVDVDPATGDDVTGLSVHQTRIIVFKENSVWEVRLSNTTMGNYLVLEPTYNLITASQGCTSHRSIAAVDNDLLFLHRKGVYVLGYEPNITGDVLRTNELSAKIRPFFETLSEYDIHNATAVYFDYKYIIAFPRAKKCIIFDKERIAWMGPWSTHFGINKFIKFVDSAGIERLLAADDTDNYVTEFSKALKDDKGVAFGTILRTKKDDFGDWTLFKNVQDVYYNFRNVTGNLNVNVFFEDRDGNSITADSFDVTGPDTNITTGWGLDLWGQARWGSTNYDMLTYSEELIKREPIFKQGRYVQYEILTSENQDSYELLNIRTIAIPQGIGSFNHLWNVRQ